MKVIMLNKFKHYPESLRNSVGLISLTVMIFFAFFVLNIIFGPDKNAEIKNSNKSSLPSSAKQRAIPSNKDFTSFEREYIKRSEDRRPIGNNSSGQKVDERHNNIITNIIQDSNTKTRGRTTWDCCKHKKETDGKIYCTEFHSFCGKEKCKRATE